MMATAVAAEREFSGGPGDDEGRTANLTTTALVDRRRERLRIADSDERFRTRGFRTRGFRMRDSGSGIQDQRSGIRDRGLRTSGRSRFGSSIGAFSVMTPVRAAAYVGSAIVMGWLASATSVSPPAAVLRMPKSSADGQALGAIATDVQAQASRLRQRLASAPAPQPPVRNPFQFGSHELPKRRGPVHADPAPADTAPDLLAAEPPLALIGVAEQKSPFGLI